GSALYLCRLSRNRRAGAAAWARRRGAWAVRHLSPRHSHSHRDAAVLGCLSDSPGRPGGDARGQCRRGRYSRSGPVNPVFTSSVKGPGDFAIALVGFVLLTAWRAPPLIVVVASACGGMALALALA